MKSTLAALLLAQAMTAPLPQSPRPATLEICRIEPGAQLVIEFVYSTEEMTRSAVADTEGRVKFENLPEGEWVIVEGGGRLNHKPSDRPIDVDGNTVYPFAECVKMPT